MLPGHSTARWVLVARECVQELASLLFPVALTISSAEGGRGAAPSAAGKAHTALTPCPQRPRSSSSPGGARAALCQGQPAVALPRHPSNRTQHRQLQKMVPTTLGLPVFLT